MSYEEKGQWVYVFSIGLTFAAYVLIVARQAATGPLTEWDYVPTLLWAIGIGIALSIAGRMLIEIAKPSESYATDARDRDIGRFGEYVSGTILGVGMVVPFILALAEFDYFWIANAMYAAFALAAFIGTVVKVVAYRRGI
jgi:drug/metabolite transporter (DMT)-like permease